MFVKHIDLTAQPSIPNTNHQWGDRVLDKVQHGALSALHEQQGLECLAVGVTEVANQSVCGV